MQEQRPEQRDETVTADDADDEEIAFKDTVINPSNEIANPGDEIAFKNTTVEN